MSDAVYYSLCGVLTIGVLLGIYLMSRVETAVRGNMLSAACTAGAIVLTLFQYRVIGHWDLWASMVIALLISGAWVRRIKMIDMPQVVALLNGLGGAVSAVVAAMSLGVGPVLGLFELVTAGLALVVGSITLTGSLIAAAKLHKIIGQHPVQWPYHHGITTLVLALALVSIALIATGLIPMGIAVLLCAVSSGLFGVAFAIRVGGADMPITISLLNSLSGVAGAIAGMAIGDPLLVAIGGVVGASGLLLTQIMCKAMNRSLNDILMGKTSTTSGGQKHPAVSQGQTETAPEGEAEDYAALLRQARQVIIVPGYGMAIAQAQQVVKELAERLEEQGASVNFAIHPVAGRMPGHMNVLLAEVDVPYEKLLEMEDGNDRFGECDMVIIVGANDVVNPAANTAEGTPIYGMPVLNVQEAKHIIICNFDRNPGYAGVPNPLYGMGHVTLLEGNAADTVRAMLDAL